MGHHTFIAYLAAALLLASGTASAQSYQNEKVLRIYREQRIQAKRSQDAADDRRHIIESCERRGGRNCDGSAPVNTYESVGMLGGTLANMAARMQTRNVETKVILSESDKRSLLESQVQKGDAAAAVLLGDIYRAGYQVAKDEARAMQWYEKAASLGDVKSQTEIAWKYLLGDTVAKSPPTAYRWFEAAANKGDGEAQYVAGVMNAIGVGTAPNDTQAVGWYLKSAASGNAAGQYAAGIRHHDGKGVPQDYATALKWFRAAAEQGHSDAQYNYAVMHTKGRGVASSWAAYQTAQQWYEKSAENGNVNAQFMACMNYGSGIGVAQDFRKAELWCERAVAQGDNEAKSLLASIKDEVKKVGYGDTPPK